MPSYVYRVYYEDTDCSGVMYHARYLSFAERARTDFLRERGFEQQDLLNQTGLVFTLSEALARYFSPVRLDDELCVSVTIEQLGRASLRFAQTLMVGDRLCASLHTRAACVRYTDFKPQALPESLRQALATHLS